MSPLKSALAGLAVGLIAYFIVGAMHPTQGDSDVALIGTSVAPTLAPSATEVPKIGTKSGTKSVVGAKVVPPTFAPAGTSVAPTPDVSVTPRLQAVISPSVSPTLSVVPSSAPTPTPVVPHTVTPTPTPSASVAPTPTPTAAATPTPTSTGTSQVVINEIGWSGTATNSADEWLELYNAGTAVQELNGWTLCDDGGPIVTFSALHHIDKGKFFLIERGDDTTISDIKADFAHSFGSSGFLNAGEHLTLRNGSCTDGTIVDEVGPGKWYAGSASPDFKSMERISSDASGTDASNWATWGSVQDSGGNVNSTGLDAAGNPINGTPKFKNSVSL